MKDNRQQTENGKSLNLYQMGNWVNREYMKRFFDYGDTQILELSKNKSIITPRIRNRLFFDIVSVNKFLEDHIESKKK